MDLATIIGLLLAFGGIIAGFLLEHGDLMTLLLVSPAAIVFGGTIGATVISFKMKQVVKLPKLFAESFGNASSNMSSNLETLCEMATKAKREGLLTLEQYISQNPKFDPILVKGVMLIIDGTNPERVRNILESELSLFEKAKHSEISMFEAMGGFAPTMGVLGTVMGLVQTLSHMGAPEELTASIAAAFIATLYGVGFANLLCLPIATKLKNNLKMSSTEKEMIIEGVLAIQAGESIRAIREFLTPYLDFAGIKSDKGEVKS